MTQKQQVIERLLTEYGDAILRICYLYLKDYQLAEDALQETFIKAMKGYDNFMSRSSEKTWLSKIAINTCKNMMRTQWFKNVFLSGEDSVSIAAIDETSSWIEKSDVTTAIMNLPKNDKDVIILYYYQELSIKEISTIIGKSENTVNQRLFRARKKLKENLKGVDFDEPKS